MKNPELLLRENIRDLISFVKKKNNKKVSEEDQLRGVIREFLKLELSTLTEVSTPDNDPTPHSSTGINVLEDLLKKIIPVLETDYKLLTTAAEQRESFRAHIVNAVVDTLTPVETNNAAEPESQELEEEIEIDVGEEDDQDEMFIDIDADKKKQEKEVEEDPRDQFGIEGRDTTGRNMAYSSFKKIETSIIDAYELLSGAEDQEIFFDYLIANLKLYFDKFEDELSPTAVEPTNQAYKDAKAGQTGTASEEPEELDLEI
jgi:hypothetical protein